MDLSAPFFRFGLFGDDASLVVAFAIGIGFGFFLERAGFGSARKLAAQFYLTDLTVFKVMFTAVVTAMLGIFWLSWFGFVDYTLVSVPATYLLPQIIGGLIFGIGFVVGGYCPGTACIASSTGKLDGGIHLLGMITGIILFGEVFPWLEGLYYSTAFGTFTLAEAFGLSHGVIVFLVVTAALGGFLLAERIEERHGNRPPIS